MFNFFIKYFLGCVYLISCFYAHSQPASIDKYGIEVQSYGYNRVLLGKTDEGQYLVQDFYYTGERFSSVFMLSNPLELIDFDAQYPDKLIFKQINYIPYTSWYKNGKRRSAVRLLEDGQILYTQWYKNGFKAAETKLTKTFSKKWHLSWYPNGQLKSALSYANGHLNGIQKYWYVNGQLKKQVSYQENKLHGLYQRWFESGQIYEEKNYNTGKLHGAYKKWYETGVINSDTFYKNNQLEEYYKQWYESGLLSAYYQYEKNVTYFVSYDKQGNKMADIELNAGQVIFKPVFTRKLLEKIPAGFIVQDFYQSGNKRTDPYLLVNEEDVYNNKIIQENCIVNCFPLFIHGKSLSIEGEYVQYSPGGEIILQLNYRNGQKEGVQVFIDKIHANRLEIVFKAGLYDGIAKYWKNGIQQSELFYKHGQLEGLAKYWYKNGQIAQEINYKAGMRHGLFIKWHQNGHISERKIYKKDIIEGISALWYADGQIASQELYFNGELLFAQSWYVNGLNKYIQYYKNNRLKFITYWAVEPGYFQMRFWDDSGLLNLATVYKNYRKVLDVSESHPSKLLWYD